ATALRVLPCTFGLGVFWTLKIELWADALTARPATARRAAACVAARRHRQIMVFMNSSKSDENGKCHYKRTQGRPEGCRNFVKRPSRIGVNCLRARKRRSATLGERSGLFRRLSAG